MGESQRDHDELHAAGAQRQRPEQQGDDAAQQHRQRQRHQQLVAAGHKSEKRIARYEMAVEDADDIAADAEKGGVPEAHQTAVTQDQIEAGGRDGIDRHARRERDQGEIADRLGEIRKRDQAGRHDRKASQIRPAASACAPDRRAARRAFSLAHGTVLPAGSAAPAPSPGRSPWTKARRPAHRPRKPS